MTAKPLRCNRCRRVLHRPPIAGYGPKCAARYGLKPARKPRVRMPARSGGGEVPVLDGWDELIEEECRMGEGPVSPRRITRRRVGGWRMPEGAVYVGWPGRWGNPFPVCEHRTRQQAVDQFARLLRGVVRGVDLCEHARSTVYPELWEVREFLAGRDLACWCPQGLACHGDVLLRVANNLGDEG
jgi:hypothetical protein